MFQSIRNLPADYIEDLDTTQTRSVTKLPAELVVECILHSDQNPPVTLSPLDLVVECILHSDQVQLEIMDYPISPNFEFISSENTRYMLESAYDTITKLEKWNYLREYVISENTGYMFAAEDSINELMDQINCDYKSGHSGCSMALTMRTMDFIAKNGFDSFRESVVQESVSKFSEIAEDADASVVRNNWLYMNNKIQKSDEEITDDDDEEMPALEPDSENDDDEEMPALEPDSENDDDDEMPALEPVSDDDDEEMPALEPDSENDDDDEMPALEPLSDDDDDEMPPLIPSPQMHPLDPSFDFMKLYKHEAESAYQTVQRTEMWNYLFNYTTDEMRGYMFSEDPKIIELTHQIQQDYGGMHSGSSMALTMRFMELIAKEGFDVFREECIRQKM